MHGNPQTLVLKLEKEREDALATVKQLKAEGAELREVGGDHARS